MQLINKKNLLSLYVIVRDTINFYRINNNKMMKKTFTHFFFHVFLRQRFQSIFMRTGAAQQSQHSEEFPLTRKIDARNSILDTRSFFRSQLVKRKTQHVYGQFNAKMRVLRSSWQQIDSFSNGCADPLHVCER